MQLIPLRIALNFIVCGVVLPLFLLSCSTAPLKPANGVSSPAAASLPLTTPVISAPQPVQYYTYRVINVFPHDPQAFTQGLTFDQGRLYEGTGRHRHSSLRRVELETGEVLQNYQLPEEYWGEGITAYKETLIQLTYQSHTGFVYNKNSFDILRQFTYPTEGWGITTWGNRLVMSDGTSRLYFLDPLTLQTSGSIVVLDNGIPVFKINELEYIKDRIFANIWYTDKIAMIDPSNGQVSGWLDLSGLLSAEFAGKVDVLNGIAFDVETDRLFVTGKLWPYLFEIQVIEDIRH